MWHTCRMAQRRRIGTIRITQTRRVTVTRTVRQRVVTSPTVVLSSLSPPSTSRPIAGRTSRLTYTQPERAFLEHVRDVVEDDVERERDVFLCHAWADRSGPASVLFEALSGLDVDVWFSEREVVLGRSLTRQLDAGLRVSRVGIVLVTPNMMTALRDGGLADKELGALLATDRVIPVTHDVTYDELRVESPLLASRAGLTTADSSLGEVAAKIAESVLGVDLD